LIFEIDDPVPEWIVRAEPTEAINGAHFGVEAVVERFEDGSVMVWALRDLLPGDFLIRFDINGCPEGELVTPPIAWHTAPYQSGRTGFEPGHLSLFFDPEAGCTYLGYRPAQGDEIGQVAP